MKILQYCMYYLFLVFCSGFVIFVTLGIFVLFDNPALLLENVQYDSNNHQIPEENLKKRVFFQYIFSAIINLGLAIAMYILYISKQKPPASLIPNINTNIENEINTSISNENINGSAAELATPAIDASFPMGEKEPLYDKTASMSSGSGE